MSVRKSDDFIADLEQQFEWYVIQAGWEIADRYLDSVEATCRLLGQHPLLDHEPVSLTSDSATGDSWWCSGLFKNLFSSMK